jgi:hypothetical protein
MQNRTSIANTVLVDLQNTADLLKQMKKWGQAILR